MKPKGCPFGYMKFKGIQFYTYDKIKPNKQLKQLQIDLSVVKLNENWSIWLWLRLQITSKGWLKKNGESYLLLTTRKVAL